MKVNAALGEETSRELRRPGRHSPEPVVAKLLLARKAEADVRAAAGATPAAAGGDRPERSVRGSWVERRIFGGRRRLRRGCDILRRALVMHPLGLARCGLQVATGVGVRDALRFVAQVR